MKPERNKDTSMSQFDPERLRAIRRLRRYTLRQLADETGVSTSYLSRLENGLANPSISLLSKIANKLSVPVSSMLRRDDGSLESEEALYQFLMQPVEALREEYPNLFTDRIMQLIYSVVNTGIYFKEDDHWLMLAILLNKSFTAKRL